MRLDKLLRICVVALVCVTFGVQSVYAGCTKCAGSQDGGGGSSGGGNPSGGETGQPPGNQDDGGSKCGAGGPSVAGDPVYTFSGEFAYRCHDLHIPGRGMDVSIDHVYRSGKVFNNMFGHGWFINYYYRINALSTGNALLRSGDGRVDEFTFSGSSYIPPPGLFQKLVRNADGTWVLTKDHGTEYHFNNKGVLTRIVDRNGNAITFTYAASPTVIKGYSPFVAAASGSGGTSGGIAPLSKDYQLLKITDTLGRDINFTYNADNRLATIKDFTGRTVKFAYDANFNLTSITRPATPQFPSGVTKSFTYDARNNMLSIKDEKAQTFLVNEYDTQDRVTRQTWGTGVYQFAYEPNKTTVTDPNGTRKVITFDAIGNPLTSTVLTRGVRAGDPAQFQTTYAYDSMANLTAVTYPAGNGVKYTYDTLNPNPAYWGNVLTIRQKASMAAPDDDATDIIYKLTYEPNFNFVQTITDPKNSTYALTYDAKGNVTKMTFPSVGGASPEYTIAYNAYGQPVLMTDPVGTITAYTYHATSALLTKIVQNSGGLNAATNIVYNAYGFVSKIIDPVARTSTYTVDALGRRTELTDPMGFKTKWTYDANGNVTKVENQADAAASTWQTTSFVYDIVNKVTSIQDPLNRITTYAYDQNQNLVSVKDANNNTTTYTYDERDFLFKVTDARTPAGITQYAYDFNGNLKKITDAQGNPTTYAYDGFDRLIAMMYADGTQEQYAYDKNSNVISKTTPSGKVINYTYDVLNRVTAKNFPAAAILNTAYAYDAASRLTSAIVSGANNTFVYDALGRLLTNNQRLKTTTYRFIYRYDKAGNLIKTVYPNGKVLDYVLDANENVKSIAVNSTVLANYTYDPLNRRTQKNFTGAPGLSTSYTFDIANQLTGMANNIVSGAGISAFNYTYDQVGNRTSMTVTPGGTQNYVYNPIYELTGVTGAQTHSYAYDQVGSRTTANSIPYTSNSLNQYTAVNAVPMAYDLNGNLTHDGTAAYTYDEENRLSKVVKGGVTTTYTYDAFNRRVSKTVGGVVTYFVHDGQDIVEERDNAGALIADYVYGPQVDEPLVMTRGGVGYYYFTDGLGSVRNLTNAAGAIIETYDYDPYGKPTTLSTVGNPIMFTGRWYDAESGNYYYRARQYSPTMGRFLQRDPIGYYDGMNLYQYTLNNPINYTDPSGKNIKLVGDILGGILFGTPQGRSLLGRILGGLNNLGKILGGLGDLLGGDKAAMCSVANNGSGNGSQNGNNNQEGDGKEPHQPYAKGGPPRVPEGQPGAGNYLPDPKAEGPHTTLGKRTDGEGGYTQGATFDGDGNFVGRTDVSSHGGTHPNPHFHPSNGPNRVKPAEPINKS